MNKFIRIPLGTSNSYLIKAEDGYLLVDAGNRHQADRFMECLNAHDISPTQIRLIILTHTHFDHIGSLAEIRKLCNCQVAVHQQESDLLITGQVVIPNGTNLLGKSMSRVGRTLAKRWSPSQPVNPDIQICGEMSLDQFGVTGRIIPTPGHTDDSISVLLSTGEAFVGDLTVNYLPFGLGPIFPPFANDINALMKSWGKIIDAGAKTISPGHGKTFDVGLLIKKYESMLEKFIS